MQILKVESVIIIILSIGLVVGIFFLVLAILHFRRCIRLLEALNTHLGNNLEDTSHEKKLLLVAKRPLSVTEKKFFTLFLEGKTTEEIAELMHVEQSSVYTMKYRIKKKFPEKFHLPF